MIIWERLVADRNPLPFLDFLSLRSMGRVRNKNAGLRLIRCMIYLVLLSVFAPNFVSASSSVFPFEIRCSTNASSCFFAFSI